MLAVVMQDVRDHLFRYARAEDGAWVRKEIAFPGQGTTWLSNTDPDHDTFLVSLQILPAAATLYHVDAGRWRRRIIDQAPPALRPGSVRIRQLLRDVEGRHARSVLPRRSQGPRRPTASTRRCSTATAASASPAPLLPRRDWARTGSTAAASTWSRTSAAAASTARAGTRPRFGRSATRRSRTSRPSPRTSIARKFTSPEHLGIRGGSNGGLLVGACFTRRPDLFGAVVCQAPLLDMRRYKQLLAGASWVAEYGDPDVPEDWAFLKTYSPYHNVAERGDVPARLSSRPPRRTIASTPATRARWSRG